MRCSKRFESAEWYDLAKEQDVLIIGLGGIGSWLALFLSRIGCNIYGFDMDTVEDHNIGGQFFSLADIGQEKTTSTLDKVKLFSNGTFSSEGKYDKDSLDHHIVFCCADDMNIRKLAFEKWLEFSKDCSSDVAPIFFDGRMQMEYSEVYCSLSDSSMIEKYRESLFNNEDTPDLPCNAKATTHVGAKTASIMTEIFINHIVNCKEKDSIRTIPYLVINDPRMLILDVYENI